MYTRGLLFLLPPGGDPHYWGLCALKVGRSYAGEAKCWSEDNKHGDHMTFNDANSHLGSVGFDNTIQSVKVTGVWMFYDEHDYNTIVADPSQMFYVHGLDYVTTLPDMYKNMATSLRYSGSADKLNDDYWSIYQGLYFAGDTFGGTNEMSDLSFITYDVFSVILVGESQWTFCEGVNYAAPCVCMWPDTHHDDTLFRHLDVGLFPTLTSYGGVLHVMSVRKGCHGKVISSNSTMTHVSQGTNGGFGYIKMD